MITNDGDIYKYSLILLYFLVSLKCGRQDGNWMTVGVVIHRACLLHFSLKGR